MQYLAHAFNDNTIRFVLRYPCIVPPEMVEKAARHMVYSVDILHASFVSDPIGAHWQLQMDVPENAYFTCTRVTGDPLRAAVEKSLQSVPLAGPAQVQVHLVQGDEQSALAVCMSHLCVDGADGRYLLETLFACLNELEETGACAAVQVKNGRRDPEQLYESLDRKTYRSLLKSPMTQVKSLFPFPGETAGTPRILTSLISSQDMALAREKARRQGVTVNDVLLASCYHAFAALPGVDGKGALSIMSMMDVRRHCFQGRTEGLCNMAGTLPTVLHEGVSDNFDDTLSQIAAQTKACKEDPLCGLAGLPLLHGAVRCLPTRLLLKAVGRIYRQMAVGMTNLGNLDGEKLRLCGAVPDAMVFGGPLKKKPNVQLSVASLDGACTLSIVGSYAEEDVPLLQQLLDDTAAQTIAWART